MVLFKFLFIYSMPQISCNIFLIFKNKGYLRLGCMARDRGQIYEASDWFKEALQVNQVYIITLFLFVFLKPKL